MLKVVQTKERSIQEQGDIYRDIKISMGYVLVSKEKEAMVKLKDNWKGFFLENHILWLYKNSAAFFPG